MPALRGKEFYLAQASSPRAKPARVVAGLVIALILGFFAPYIALAPVVPVVIAFLYAYAGFIPAAACAALSLGSYAISFGATGAFIGLAAHIAPAALIVRGIRARMPFFRQIAAAIAALALGAVFALGIAAAALNSNLIGALTEAMRSTLASTEAAYPGFIDMVAARTYGIPGAPELMTPDLLTRGFLSAEQRAGYAAALLNDMTAALALALPGYLLSTAALSGLLSVAWPGYVRRAESEADGSYLPLARWYAPFQVSLGLLATLGVSHLLFLQKVQGGDTLYVTIESILRLVFLVQAAASIERRMQAFGARAWLRVAVILVTALFFSGFAAYYGAASALVGSRGAMRQLMERRANKQ